MTKNHTYLLRTVTAIPGNKLLKRTIGKLFETRILTRIESDKEVFLGVVAKAGPIEIGQRAEFSFYPTDSLDILSLVTGKVIGIDETFS